MKLQVIFPHLDEQQRQLLLGTGARGAEAWRDPGGGPGCLRPALLAGVSKRNKVAHRPFPHFR